MGGLVSTLVGTIRASEVYKKPLPNDCAWIRGLIDVLNVDSIRKALADQLPAVHHHLLSEEVASARMSEKFRRKKKLKKKNEISKENPIQSNVPTKKQLQNMYWPPKKGLRC